MRKFTSILLSVLMVISMVTLGAVNVSAVDTEETATVQTASEVNAEEAEKKADEPALSGAQEDAQVSQAATLTGIEIASLPDVAEYPVDTEVDLSYELSGLSVKALYSDGTSEVFDYDWDWDFFESVKFSGDNVSREVLTVQSGENTVKLAYKGKTATFVIKGFTVKSLEVISLPDYCFIAGNTYYLQGCLDGMSVRLTAEDGKIINYSYDDGDGYYFFSSAVYSGDCLDELGEDFTPATGENKVTMTYGGASAEFSLFAKELASFEILTTPDKINYIVGESCFLGDNAEGMSVYVSYTDDTAAVYSYDDYEGNGHAFFAREITYSGDCFDEWGEYMTPVLGENVITVTCGGLSDEFSVFAREIASISIVSMPEYDFLSGETYYIQDCLNGMTVNVVFSDGTGEYYSYDDYENGGYSFFYMASYSGDGFDEFGYFVPVTGDNTVTMSYSGATAEFSVYAREVSSLTVITAPEYEFISGETYYIQDRLNGMTVKAEFSDGTSSYYSYNDWENGGYSFFYSASYSGDCFDEWDYFVPVTGENIITMTYGGQSLEFSVYAREVESVEILTLPDRTEYYADTEYVLLNTLSGITLKVTYNDGTEIYSFDDYGNGGWDFFVYRVEFSGDCIFYDDEVNLSPGENVITLSYGGKTAEMVFTGTEVAALEILAEPEPYNFFAGIDYDITEYLYGMQVQLTLADGSTVTYNYDEDRTFFYRDLKYSINGEEGWYHSLNDGESLVTATCGGVSDTFTLNAREATSLEVITPPNETTLYANTENNVFDCLEGLVLQASFRDGTVEQFACDSRYDDDSVYDFYYEVLSCFGNGVELEYWESFYTVPGENTITLSVGEASCDVTLYANEVTALEIVTPPNDYRYIAGVEYDISNCLEGIEIKITLDDGTVETYSFADWENGGYEFCAYSVSYCDEDLNSEYVKLHPGKNVITAEFGGASDTFTVNAVEATKLQITAQPQTTVIAGMPYYTEDFLSGLAVHVEYSDGVACDYEYDKMNEEYESYNFFSNAEYQSAYSYGNNGTFVFEPGANTVTLTYGGLSADFTVNSQQLSSFEITALPYKTDFYAGNSYSPEECFEGLSAKIVFADGTSQELYYGEADSSMFELSGDCFDWDGYFAPEAGENVITVSCAGCSDSFTLTGLAVTDLRITKLPDRTEYIAYNYKDDYAICRGMELELTFDDGTTRTYTTATDGEFFATELTLSGECIAWGDFYPYPGENLITVSCGEGSDSFTVTAKEVTEIEITKLPDITEFIAGNGKYLSSYIYGMEVKLTYADGAQELYNTKDNGAFFFEELSFSGDNVFAGYLYTEEGENIIEVYCGDASAQYSVTGLGIAGLEVTKQPEMTLEAGNRYYITNCLDGTEVTVTFTDGSTRVYAYDNPDDSDFFYEEIFFGDDYGQLTSFTAKAGTNKFTLYCADACTDITFNSEGGEKIKGDVNSDGEYSIKDAAAIQLYIAQLYHGTFDESVADVNGDGEIGIKDAAYIQLDLAKLL